MPISEAQKRSRNKWDKENMKIVACKIRKDYAERFKQYAADNGTTPNALIKSYVLKAIGEKDGADE
ncbi:MAG: hypothetical protein Q4E74_09620 [Ruminococcus sp.]|nr:hypothetical protein [Ruminococcus sp.]